ncbi:PP2C-like domain-containing protein CG9801 [Lucilia cuprina]|uniref:PP2C-like domain-containing protein CG9801 n=1 Tax=Lucilia cuprina TaxID=7375 RepID=UPI001F05A84C|nr:PP2C-like domain-containing protein CG9801 [Lucilia cuprina]
MPSLRQKVTTYFRQLSFIAEPRDGPKSPRKTDEDGNFIIKYLEGRMDRIFTNGPEVYNGQNPTDLPDYPIATYPTGPNTITAACTGPDDGLTGIKRSKLHLSASYADDIDFIDTIQESDCFEVRKSINPTNNRNHNRFQRYGSGRRLSNGASTSQNDQNANKTNGITTGGMRSRKNSKTGIANLSQNQNQTKDVTLGGGGGAGGVSGKTQQKNEENLSKSTTIVVSMVATSKSTAVNTTTAADMKTDAANDQNNKNLLNTKTESNNTANSKLKESGDPKTELGTVKILEGTTERLLREAVSNQSTVHDVDDSIAGVSNWKMECDSAYGISVSLYENNMLTKEPMGNPIADCYGMVVRGNAAAMALADGVNWGDGARLAARSAVHGCLDYLDRAIFGLAHECMATSTQEVFISLLRSLWEGHGCILEVGGALSTLTIAVVLPLAKESGGDENGVDMEGEQSEKYVVCACNVGDSLGYVYSKKHGVREFTLASHDITSMRDMRDALGALGPADGNKPELSNLTLSMTIIDRGDIVFLTSDGVSDNFDPVVGKFAEAWTPDVKLMPTTTSPPQRSGSVLAPKRQNKSASAIYARLHGSSNPTSPVPPVRPPRSKKSSSPENPAAPSRPKYMRSQTVIEPRRLSSGAANVGHITYNYKPKIPKSLTGLPLVTGPQRHALTLHRLEDLLSYGINGTFSPCSSARRLCHLLIDFVRMITSARRKTLEQRELFYKLSTGPDGIKREVELNRMQHRAARKRVIDSAAFGALPGKLDHATVVAYTVGSGGRTQSKSNQHTPQISLTTERQLSNDDAALQSKEFQETNF